MDRQTEMKIALATARKNTIQDQINKQKEQVAKIQDSIGVLEERILKIDKDINKIRIQNQRKEKMQANKSFIDDASVEEDAPVIGGDASTTTASLDASSQSLGAGSYKPGWKFYDKIVDVKRHKKLKKIQEYVSSVIDTVDDNYEEVNNG